MSELAAEGPWAQKPAARLTSRASRSGCRGGPSHLLTESLQVTPQGQTHRDTKSSLSGPARPLLPGPCFPALAGIPGSGFQPHPRRAQVETITMVTLVSEGQRCFWKNDTPAPSTRCSVGSAGALLAVCPVWPPGQQERVCLLLRKGEGSPGLSMLQAVWRKRLVLWLGCGHLGCDPPGSPGEGHLGRVPPRVPEEGCLPLPAPVPGREASMTLCLPTGPSRQKLEVAPSTGGWL